VAHLATNQPARNRNFRNQKLDVKTSQRNAVMIASGNGVGVSGIEGWEMKRCQLQNVLGV
jgi:hypothetical protein